MSSGAVVITVFADASYKNGAAGYAVWGRSNGPSKLEYSNPIKWLVRSSDEAETIALAHAIILGLENFHVVGDEAILVAESDCLSALTKMRLIGGVPSKTSDCKIGMCAKEPEGDQLRFILRAGEELKVRNVKLYLKHVRGHKGGFAVRTTVNRWCDTMAKEARVKAEEYLFS